MAHAQEFWVIGVVVELAFPQIGLGRRDRVIGHLEHHAAAAAAAVEPEHQPGLLGGAAIAIGIEAEAAVIADQHGRMGGDMGKAGVPHQGAVAEHPVVIGGGVGGGRAAIDGIEGTHGASARV